MAIGFGVFGGTDWTPPVTCVSWLEAFAFCAWDGGRLPTDLELNYAAAGGSEQRVYPWTAPGTKAAIDPSRANYCSKIRGVGNLTECIESPLPEIQPVGSKSPLGDGRWGHADLAGNAWEPTLDFDAALVPGQPCVDCAALDAPAGTKRRYRGGARWE